MTSNTDGNSAKLVGYTTRELAGHRRRISAIGWSTTGKKLASGSNDGSIRVWSIEPHCQVSKPERSDTELKGHNEMVTGVAWKPGSESVLASCVPGDSRVDKVVRLWDVKSSKCTNSVPVSCSAAAVSWCPDGSSLAVLTEDDTVSIVDPRKGRVFKTLRFPTSTFDLRWGPSNHQLLVGNDKGCVDIVSCMNLEVMWSLKGHTGQTFTICISGNQKYVASGGGDALLCLWDLDDMSCCRTWAHMNGAIRGTSISHDNAFLAYCTEDYEAEILSTFTGERLQTLKLKSGCDCVAWSPTHNVLAFSDEVIDPQTKDRVGTVNIMAPPKAS